MCYREMQEIQTCSEEQCKDLSYSHVTVTAGGVGAQLFRRRYASVAQIRPFSAVTFDKRPEPGFLAMLWFGVPLQKQRYVFASTR